MGNKNYIIKKEKNNQTETVTKNIEDKCSLEKINSKFIIDNIFGYISIKFELELLKYSKFFQQKLNIDLNDYKYKFISKKFNVENYFILNYENEKFDKLDLYKKAEKEIKKKNLNLSINEIHDIIRAYNEKHMNNERSYELNTFLSGRIGSFSSYYDIFSPFIDFSSYHENKFFKIPLNFIEKYDLKNDFISFFEKNKKTNNLLFIEFENSEQIKTLKEINIDYSKVKVLYFTNYKDTNINNSFFLEMFNLINVKNNLETLCLHFLYTKKVDADAFNSLNDLKTLKHIELEYLEFSQIFKITLLNLEIIGLVKCKNIYFNNNENSTKNLRHLELYDIDFKIICCH